MSGFQRLTVQVGALEELPAVATTPDVQDLLRRAGADAASLNRLRYPTGAGAFGRADLLVTGDTLAALRDAYAIDAETQPATITLRMGSDSAFAAPGAPGPGGVSVRGLVPLSPRPLVATMRGQALYALPLVDERWFWRDPASASWNVSAPDKTRVYTGSLSTHEAIAAALLEDLQVPAPLRPTYASGALNPPANFASEGAPAASALDRLLAETGHLFVRDYLHTTSAAPYRIVALASQTPWAALSPLEASIAAGSACWSEGASAMTVLGQGMPATSWMRNNVPSSVVVRFPQYDGRGFRQRRYSVTVALSSLPIAAQVKATTSIRKTIVDSYPALIDSGGAAVNATALSNRAKQLATAFYSRFVAGETHCILAGAQQVAMGGAVRDVEWSHDGERGCFTVVRTSVADPALGFEDPPAVAAGGAPGVSMFDSLGGSLADPDTRDVPGKITARSTGSDDFVENITYSATFDDAELGAEVYTNLTPIFRHFPAATARVNPAAIGSRCTLRLSTYFDGTRRTVDLLQCAETIATEACPTTTDSVTVADYEAMLSAGIRASRRTSNFLTGRTPRVLAYKSVDAAGLGALGAVLTDRAGKPRFGKDGSLLVGRIPAGSEFAADAARAIGSLRSKRPRINRDWSVLVPS